MARRIGPWTIVFLIGFVMYGAAGWWSGGGRRSAVFYAVSLALLAFALLGVLRGRSPKPPL